MPLGRKERRMTITIHIGSLVFGLIIGVVFAFIVFSAVFFADGGLWSKGFYDGWKKGSKYAERKEE